MYDHDCERGRTTPFQEKIDKMIENEVTRRLSDRIKQAEHDVEYYKNEMWKAKKQTSNTVHKLVSLERETDEKIKDAVKVAQREYWFDCAIGDYVYLINYKHHKRKCERCNGTRRVEVIVDGTHVNADCPVCGTYEKAKSLEYHEPYIKGSKVRRLSIEMTENHKWIRLWLDDDEEFKIELEYHKIFRTKEDAEEALKEVLANE